MVRRTIAVSTILAASLAFGGALQIASAKEVTLRMSYFGGPKGTTWKYVLQPWADAVNKEGKGIVKVETFPGGALVRSPRAQVKALTDGVADIAFVVFSYTPGRFPDNGVLELPTLYNDVSESSKTIRALYDKGMLRGYDKFYVNMIVTTYPYNFHTTKPVKTIADLKGKKIRAGGPVAGAAIRALGAVPVGMPIPTVAENISKGVLDGAASDWNVLYSFRINQVAKNHYMQHFSTVPIGFMMTKKRLNSLPKKAQEIIKKYSGKWVEDLYIKTNKDINKKWLAVTKKTKGHSIVNPTTADKAAYDRIMAGVVTKWANNDKRKKILATVRAELKKIRGVPKN